MRLFHFSDNAGIEVFHSRSPRIRADRPQGQEWLNDPLVWGIDEEHEFMYLFPRECPRILIWAQAGTSEKDRTTWLEGYRAVAFIEAGWLDQLRNGTIHRYELPTASFQSLADAGMWVSRQSVRPLDHVVMSNLDTAFEPRGVRLAAVDTLSQYKPLWETSLHTSGIRLRNARGW